ncbi:receptor-like kinase TMK4 [Punica granatum]|uniref:non-specific serine/threonine protein kinase n=2 Tax=Punica granatum TaxID=22663 RepID=A0A218XH25_PUNGR|nr:receptor-like kinase TMK4 [Punica granatum]OWM84233.1 hypothetical protein CDL15_Pgr011618 [Punica granatum]PKI61146.1 hypothetical protein CRG98_018466 [Punica granatum]
MDDNGRGSLLSLSAFFFLLVVRATTATDDDDDSSVMSKFLDGLSSPPQGWSSRTSYCKWTGVSCDSSSHVTSISLESMSLSGTLPSDLSPLSRLKSVSLQRNSLSGSIPSFANLASLEELFLDNNNFTDIPSGAFQGLTSLQVLSVSNNPNLQPWMIPEDLKESSGLVTLYASDANVVGSLPDFFHSLSSLQHLRLSYNNLTGSLPASLGGSSIQTLWLNNQEQGLSGTLNVLSGMTQLSQAWLHKNQFTGPVPDLSKCESLFDLQLRDNLLTGIVPASLTSLSNIQNVSLDNNKLQGPIPDNSRNIKLTYHGVDTFCKTSAGPCDPQVTTLLEVAGALGYPMTLADSWSGNDACQGWIFVTCQGGKVTTVALSKQHFIGAISPSFGNLTSLRSLLLNDNNLTGSIPDSLAKLPDLEMLDVSNNNLSGLVPKFPSKVKLVTSGNPLLGKKLSSGGGSGAGGLGGSSNSAGAIAGIVITVLIIAGVVAFILFRCFHSKSSCRKTWSVKSSVHKAESSKGRAKSPQNQGNIRNNDFLIFDNGNVMVSIHVLRQVTNNFFPGNIIGRGGFGTVYRGVFEDGMEIAVKRMESSAMSDKGIHEFQAEISVLTQVRHRHLVALLGFCINGNERLLVYEFMPRGTLSQHVFEWRERQLPPLSWKQRLTIAVDVARGVEYLHSLAQQSFIHRDLKPSNILLGDDMRAKVADFGLVRNAPDGKYSVETRLAGTFGYLAPEYAATGKVTTKVDIFAFGVILMELITGRKALDDTVSDERSHLVSWFRRILINKEDLSKVIDEALDLDEETLQSITKVAELSGHCTAREPQQRPDMGHVVNILSPLIEQWRPESRYELEEDGLGMSDISLNMSLPQVLQRWQSEGTSTMYSNGTTTTSSYGLSQTDSSTPSKPSTFKDSMQSTNRR